MALSVPFRRLKVASCNSKHVIGCYQRCLSTDVDVSEDGDYIGARNKSGLRDHVRNSMEKNLKIPEVLFDFQLTKNYKRKIYAKFGRESAIDPGMMWPTREELQETMEYEQEYCPSVQQMADKYYQKKAAEESAILARAEELERNMAKLNQWKKDVIGKYNSKLAAAEAHREKKERLIEEVRSIFGYKLDPRDPKFQQILEQKEAEEKKVAKEAKKKDKLAKELAKMTGLAQQAVPSKDTVEENKE